MTDTIHVTKSAGQAGANVSAVSIEDLAALLGSDAPTVDPLIPGALWNDSGTVKVSLTPVVVSDFQNGIYSIEGVSKTLTDLWPSIPAAAQVVADVGFSVIAGTTTGATATMYASADLFAAVNPTVGFSAVMDVSLTSPTDADSLSIDLGVVKVDYQKQSAAGTTRSGGYVYTRTPSALVSGVTPNQGNNKLAISMSAAGIYMSMNGNSVITTPANTDYLTNDKLKVLVSGAFNATAVIKRVKSYPLITDLTALKRLSIP